MYIGFVLKLFIFQIITEFKLKDVNGVPGRNESGERLLEMCAEQELGVGNSCFKKNDVYKYTLLRMAEERVVDNALMNYVLLPRRMLGRLLDVKVWRGKGGIV